MSGLQHRGGRCLAWVALIGLIACGDPSTEPEPLPVLDPGSCVAGEGATARPESIAETVELINSMPRPLTLSCFLRALERPLAVNATSSRFSAQPAEGRENPRLFLFNDPLYLSVVPDGVSRDLLELSELTSDTRSIKAEILFPVTEEVPLAAAYERILNDEQGDTTLCGFCHQEDRPIESEDGPAFESMAFQPPLNLRVGLDELEVLSLDCEVQRENDRCEMLRSLVFYGPLEEHDFPEDMPFFF